MNDIILHHYPHSPFSEKIRAILGYKNLAWKSVMQPTVMPKPDQIALTGGYRKAPVLQIGADIYCDSKLIWRAIEKLHPQPPLVPPGLEASCDAMEYWSEQLLFFAVAPVVFQPQGIPHFFGANPAEQLAAFRQDRAAMFAGGSAQRPSADNLRALPGLLASIEAQLGRNSFLFGDAPTVADFSVYHPIWFVISNPGVAAYFKPYPKILTWAGRIKGLGHGKPEELDPAAAIEIARSSKPLPAGECVTDPAGLQIGDAVAVHATDYGADPAVGVLTRLARDEVAIARSDPRAGDVVVHFPRTGFRISKTT